MVGEIGVSLLGTYIIKNKPVWFNWKNTGFVL